MSKCVNELCNKNIDDCSGHIVPWGVDGDFACSQECYDKARAQMNHFYEHILPNDAAFAAWLGVPIDLVTESCSSNE